MGKILFAEKDGIQVLKLVGEVRLNQAPTIARFVESIEQSTQQKSIVIDLSETEHMDSTILGILAQIAMKSSERLASQPVLFTRREDVTRLVQSMGFEEIFILSDFSPVDCLCTELPSQLATEGAMRQQVLDAHRTLMQMNENNQRCFRELVEALEAEDRACTEADGDRKAAG